MPFYKYHWETAEVVPFSQCRLTTRKRNLHGQVTYSEETFPAVNVSYGPGPFLNSGDDRRHAHEFFREVDGHYEESYSPVPPEVEDSEALARLEVDDKAKWGIEELVTSRPLDSDTAVAMNALN